MAKLIDSDNFYSELSKTINESKEKLFLISPHISLNSELEMQLRNAAERGVSITIIFRTPDERENDTTAFIGSIKDLPGLKVLSCPELYRKLFANEQRVIETTQNLTEHNESSIETGNLHEKNQGDGLFSILLSVAEDLSVYDGCESIIDNTRTKKQNQ